MNKLIIIALFVIMFASITFAPPAILRDNLYEPCESAGNCTPTGTYINGTIYNVSVFWWVQFPGGTSENWSVVTNLQYALNTTTGNDASPILNITRSPTCPVGANITIVEEYCVDGTVGNITCIDNDDGTIALLNQTKDDYYMQANITFEILMCAGVVDKLWDFRQIADGKGASGTVDDDAWVEGWNISEAEQEEENPAANPEYIYSRAFFTMPIDLSFSITLPSGNYSNSTNTPLGNPTDFISFNYSHNTTNTHPCVNYTNVCQTSGIPIFVFENLGNLKFNWTINMTSNQPPAGIDMFVDINGDPDGSTILSYGNIYNVGIIEEDATQNLWMWVNFTYPAAGEYETNISHISHEIDKLA